MYSNHRASDLISIRQPAGAVGDGCRKDIRRSTQKLALVPCESHSGQDNCLEVAVRISRER